MSPAGTVVFSGYITQLEMKALSIPENIFLNAR